MNKTNQNNNLFRFRRLNLAFIFIFEVSAGNLLAANSKVTDSNVLSETLINGKEIRQLTASLQQERGMTCTFLGTDP